MSNLHSSIKDIHSAEDLASFADLLREDFRNAPEAWENQTVDAFLEAMAAWIRDVSKLDNNSVLNASLPDLSASPTWQTFAAILYAAKIYE